MSASDSWQLVIGVLAVADAAWLVRRWKRTGDNAIISAIIPRAYLGALYLWDAFVPRDTMEPGRTLAYRAVAVLFFSANVNHWVEYKWGKHK